MSEREAEATAPHAREVLREQLALLNEAALHDETDRAITFPRPG